MREWFDFLQPSYGLIEARFLRTGSVHQSYTMNADQLVKDITDRDAAGWDCYVGVLPRKRTSGKAEDVWPTATILWADVDAKDFCRDPERHTKGDDGPASEDKERALEAILNFPVTPSAIVDSGHGFHLYWRLWEPVDTSDAVEANQAIAKWLGADNCFDAPRILRVPGTHNHKDSENPIPVRVLKLDTLRRYDLSDFNEMVESLRTAALREHIPQTERRGDAPDWVIDKVNTEPPKGSRSEFEFAVCMALRERGYSKDEVLDALLSMPFGAKAQERGERWAAQEVERVWRK